METGRAGLRFVLGSQSNRLCSSEMPGYFIALSGFQHLESLVSSARVNDKVNETLSTTNKQTGGKVFLKEPAAGLVTFAYVYYVTK